VIRDMLTEILVSVDNQTGRDNFFFRCGCAEGLVRQQESQTLQNFSKYTTSYHSYLTRLSLFCFLIVGPI